MRTSVLVLAIAQLPAPTMADSDCLLPIHSAAERGDVETLATLLSADKYLADAEDKCDTKIRPLLLAANSGSVAAVQTLLEAGATADVAHDGNGVTPLIAAAVGGSAEMVELLLAHRAPVNRAESRNWTALSFAAQQGHMEVVNALLRRGADAAWLTGTGLSPWTLASDAGQKAVAYVLQGSSGAELREESVVYLVGELPREALAKAGVQNTSILEERLLGEYYFSKVLAGVDPQKLAVRATLRRAQEGRGLGGEEDGDVGAVKAWAVDSGPLPLYARPAGQETLFLRFDAEPSAFVWQLVGARAEKQPAEATSSRFSVATAYLRAQVADGPEARGNYLDPVNALSWEVSVALAPPETGVQWLQAPKLRLIRGSEGARHWEAQGGRLNGHGGRQPKRRKGRRKAKRKARGKKDKEEL